MRNAFGQFGKLRLGFLDTSVTTFANLGLNPGTLVNSGVSFFGGALSIGVAKAAVNIGPPISLPGASLPYSLWVDGWSNFIGVTDFIGSTNHYGLNTKFGTTIKNALSLKNGVDIKNALNCGNATTNFNAVLNANGGIKTPVIKAEVVNAVSVKCKSVTTESVTAGNGTFKTVAAPFKQFDIPHPTKEGFRLVHTCLEGPEIGVYYRGTLYDSNVIELPEYWRGLVDAESITVHLTPKGIYQELFYEIIEWGSKIKVINNSGSKINCSYIIYAERKDVDKLKIEYEEVV